MHAVSDSAGPSGQGLQLAGALRVLTLNRKNYLER